MRLIDADPLLKGRQDHTYISTHEIWNAPTVDAVEVVRCKDCIEFAGEGMYCGRDIMVHYDNFYCYYGDKGEEVTE